MRVLSIDGGGIRGVIPTIYLKEIEDICKKPINQCFDLIAGASTGGIIALALNAQDMNNKYYCADDLFELYYRNGQNIFPDSIAHDISNLFDEKYSSDPLAKLLKTRFRGTMLSHVKTEVLIPSYDIEMRCPWFFKSRNAKRDPNYDYTMLDIALATSAAPTYFEPHRIDRGHPSNYNVLIDGGLVANNPAMCACIEATEMIQSQRSQTKDGDPMSKVVLVSLGTGEQTRRLRYEDARDWGLGKWAKPAINIMLDGFSDTVHYQLNKLLPAARYLRLQARLDEDSDDLDNASQENMRKLRLAAETSINNKRSELKSICKLL